jgi:predicted acyltransferase
LRINSLDQFRGYTVAGMFLVNFLSSYKQLPALLRHHNTYNSYADTIMPHFFFAVGCSWGRTSPSRGWSGARCC